MSKDTGYIKIVDDLENENYYEEPSLSKEDRDSIINEIPGKISKQPPQWLELFRRFLSHRLIQYFKKNPDIDPEKFIANIANIDLDKIYDIIASGPTIIPEIILKAVREIIPADKKNNFYYEVFVVIILISAIIKISVNEGKFVGTPKLTEYLAERNKPPPQPAKKSFTAAEAAYDLFKINNKLKLQNMTNPEDCRDYDYFNENEIKMCERYLLEQQRNEAFVVHFGGKRTRNYRKRKTKNKKRKTRKTKRRN